MGYSTCQGDGGSGPTHRERRTCDRCDKCPRCTPAIAPLTNIQGSWFCQECKFRWKIPNWEEATA